MKENIRQILTKATFEVFEKMFFVFLEPVETETRPYDHIAAINFGGRSSGTLWLMMSKGMTESMAQNMLGCEPQEISAQMVEDCCREAANMVCGNFLRKVSEQDVFNLSLPECAAATRGDNLGLPPSAPDIISVVFESEGETLQARLSWKDAG